MGYEEWVESNRAALTRTYSQYKQLVFDPLLGVGVIDDKRGASANLWEMLYYQHLSEDKRDTYTSDEDYEYEESEESQDELLDTDEEQYSQESQ